MTTTERSTDGTRTQRIAAASGAVIAVVAAAWGSGAFGGTPIAEAADGAFDADATLLAPATAAFGVWSLIYAGLLAFAAAQATPMLGTRERVRGVAWPLVGSMALNAAWITAVQAGAVVVSVGILAGIVATLSVAAVRLTRTAPGSAVEALVVDVPTGLYLGWASVATVANVAAAGAWLLGTAPEAGTTAATGALAAVGLLAIAISRDLAVRPALAWATTATLAWGLAWIAAGRLAGAPADAVVGWAAALAAGVAVLSTAITTAAAGWRARRARRR